MTKPLISIGALGGTISMKKSAKQEGIQPSLSAQDLIADVPELADIAHINAQTIASIPSPSIHFNHLFQCLDWAEAELKKGTQGIVITQGTDTLEETAFFLNLLWKHPQPLILMGAMRSPEQAGAEGSANLLASVIVAASPASHNRGAQVVMNDEIHEATWVQKTHATFVDAFKSMIGPAGMLLEKKAIYFKTPSKRMIFDRPIHTEQKVLVWENTLAESADLIDFLIQGKAYQGLILSAFGAGHIPESLISKIAQLTQQMPVIACTRTRQGSTTKATYGYPGGEIFLQKNGVIMGQWLSPVKARLLLWLLIGLNLPLSNYSDYQNSLVYVD